MHFGTSNYISTCKKTNFTSHKQYFFGFFMSINVKETHTDQIIQNVFTLSEKSKKPSEIAAVKSRQCKMLLVQLASINVFSSCDNWSTSFFIKVHRRSVAFLTVILLLSLRQVALKKSVFYMLSP